MENIQRFIVKNNKPVRAQIMLDTETVKMLKELTRKEDRSSSSEIRFLIKHEYYRTIEPKPEIINT
jgi:hypothetical protein